MLMGASAGPMQDQDEASFVQAQSFSSGRLGLHGQTTIPFVKGAKATVQAEMTGEEPGMRHFVYGA